jgi:hypothetical protein
MRTLAIVVVTLTIGLAQPKPIVLSRADIGDNYDAVPRDLPIGDTWLGLFSTDDTSTGTTAFRLAVTKLRFFKTGEANGNMKLETTPPNALLLVSGVRAVRAGAAVTATTATGYGSLSREHPDPQITLAGREYTIRLVSREGEAYCDAVISMTSGTMTQTLFDMKNLSAEFSCDDPHFTIHWAGDLDRDGRLDLLVTFSQKYSYYPRQLWLSSMAGRGRLVGEAARYERFSQ